MLKKPIRVILKDSEDWIMAAENGCCHTHTQEYNEMQLKQYLNRKHVLLNINNISQYYSLYVIFD